MLGVRASVGTSTILQLGGLLCGSVHRASFPPLLGTEIVSQACNWARQMSEAGDGVLSPSSFTDADPSAALYSRQLGRLP